MVMSSLGSAELIFTALWQPVNGSAGNRSTAAANKRVEIRFILSMKNYQYDRQIHISRKRSEML